MLENFVIDYMLLLLSLKIFKFSTKKYKLIVASLLGATLSLISPLLYSYFSVLLKILLSILMSIIICPTKKPKQIFLLNVSFLLSTFLFGGISYALQNTLSAFLGQKVTSIPFFYILVLCILLFYLCVILISKVYKRKGSFKFEYEVTLFSETKNVKTNAFLDSGNLLLDNNEPVILIDSITFLKLYPNESLTNVLLKKTNTLSMKNTHILKISNINNSYSELIVFTLPKIEIENKTIENTPCAITLKKFNLETPTSCLLNPLLF